MDFCTKSNRNLTELEGFIVAKPYGDGAVVAGVRFPITNDIRAGSDRTCVIQTIVHKVLEIGRVYVGPIVVPRIIPVMLQQTADFPLRPQIRVKGGRTSRESAGAQYLLHGCRERQIEPRDIRSARHL